MTERISIAGQEKLTDAERSDAAARAVKACTMCSADLWPDLAAHLNVPGAAVSIGMILKDKPESEWAEILTDTHQATSRLLRLFQGSQPMPTWTEEWARKMQLFHREQRMELEARLARGEVVAYQDYDSIITAVLTSPNDNPDCKGGKPPDAYSFKKTYLTPRSR